MTTQDKKKHKTEYKKIPVLLILLLLDVLYGFSLGLSISIMSNVEAVLIIAMVIIILTFLFDDYKWMPLVLSGLIVGIFMAFVTNI
ncbi:MAG: hypothetical protein QXS81_04940 [Candidatus Micrarchaeaceae archaeon]